MGTGNGSRPPKAIRGEYELARQAPLGEFEQLVMLAILRLADNAYGVPIRREIVDRTGRQVARGAVYTTLERLESKGLVESWMGSETPARGGRRKKFYQVCPEGARLLLDSYRALARMADGLMPRLEAAAQTGAQGVVP